MRNTAEHAADPNSGLRMASNATGPRGDTWYCTAERPDTNTALPDTLTQVNVALPLPAANRSPMRPPQPDVAPSGADDCHTDCWSLCENSLGGNGTERLVYWVLVVGTISGPTLAMMASLPASQMVLSGASSFGSANWRPALLPPSGTDGVSGSRSARVRVSPARDAV